MAVLEATAFMFGSGSGSCWRTSASPSRRANFTASWAPMAPARRRSSMLTGLVPPNRGRVISTARVPPPPHAIAALGIARSFQLMTLFDEFTVQENVEVALPEFRARGFDARRAAAGNGAFESAAMSALAQVGLAEKARFVAKDLSYGERRALEIAVALAQRPRVLCLTSRPPGWAPTGPRGSPIS